MQIEMMMINRLVACFCAVVLVMTYPVSSFPVTTINGPDNAEDKNGTLRPSWSVLNNKEMCGGDMAGGMIGPDCLPPKVTRISHEYICDTVKSVLHLLLS